MLEYVEHELPAPLVSRGSSEGSVLRCSGQLWRRRKCQLQCHAALPSASVHQNVHGQRQLHMVPCVVGVDRVRFGEPMLKGEQHGIVIGISAVSKVAQSTEVLSLHWIREIQEAPVIRVRRIRAWTSRR